MQIRRLTERLFDGVEDTLEVIGLGRNLLGDNLNPVFSSGEFQNLRDAIKLDLNRLLNSVKSTAAVFTHSDAMFVIPLCQKWGVLLGQYQYQPSFQKFAYETMQLIG